MMNKIIIIIVAVFVGGYFLLQQSEKPLPSSNPQLRQNQHSESASISNDEQSGGYGFRTPFYRKDGISIQHYWPGEASFSNEETEILILNESNSSIEVKLFDLAYAVEGKNYSHKSSTWEKFPTTTSWDKIEYLNISPQYYKGEPLVLNPNQKGKLHWHIQFGPNPLDGKQTITAKLTLLKDGQTINIAEEFTRPSGTIFSNDKH